MHHSLPLLDGMYARTPGELVLPARLVRRSWWTRAVFLYALCLSLVLGLTRWHFSGGSGAGRQTRRLATTPLLA